MFCWENGIMLRACVIIFPGLDEHKCYGIVSPRFEFGTRIPGVTGRIGLVIERSSTLLVSTVTQERRYDRKDDQALKLELGTYATS